MLLFLKVDIATFSISLISATLATVYIIWKCLSYRCKYEESMLKDCKKTEAPESNPPEPGDEDKTEIFLLDYQISNKEIERRENITLVIGSILITGSFLILSEAVVRDYPVTYRPILAVVSILLLIIWLALMHETTKLLDDMTYLRLRSIENKIAQSVCSPFGIHSYLYGRAEGKWWLRLRRSFWGFILLLLSIAWLLLSMVG